MQENRKRKIEREQWRASRATASVPNKNEAEKYKHSRRSSVSVLIVRVMLLECSSQDLFHRSHENAFLFKKMHFRDFD